MNCCIGLAGATGPVLQGTELLLAGNAGRLPSVALEAAAL